MPRLLNEIHDDVEEIDDAFFEKDSDDWEWSDAEALEQEFKNESQSEIRDLNQIRGVR